MNTLRHARDWCDDVRDQLTAGGLAHHVTLDATEVGSAAQAGLHVVLVDPPRVTWLAVGAADLAWQIWAVAGGDYAEAWARLDAILTALTPLDLDTAEPATFRDPTGTEYPAYRITTTTPLNL